MKITTTKLYVGFYSRLTLPLTMWKTCLCQLPSGTGVVTLSLIPRMSISYWPRLPTWCTTSIFQNGTMWTLSLAWMPFRRSMMKLCIWWRNICESQPGEIYHQVGDRMILKFIGLISLKCLFFFPRPSVFLYPKKTMALKMPKSLQLVLEMYSLFFLCLIMAKYEASVSTIV